MLLLPGAQAQDDPARAFKEFKKMRVGAAGDGQEPTREWFCQDSSGASPLHLGRPPPGPQEDPARSELG